MSLRTDGRNAGTTGRGRDQTPPRAAFWVAAAVAALALWVSAAPTMTYPVYASEWQLTPAVTTLVFAVHPVVLVAVLVLFGGISDHIGRRASIRYGLAAELVGAAVFAVAGNVGWLFVGRAIMAIGVGLSLSPATAAMTEYVPERVRRHASAITTAATALGIMLAMVGGGALIQYAPMPLALDYWILAAVTVVVALSARLLPAHNPVEEKDRWRLRAIRVPRRQLAVFVTAAITLSGSFVMGSVVLSLGAQIARQLVGSTNALVTGCLLSVFAVVVAVAALVFSRVPVWLTIVLGGLASAGGLVLLAVAGVTGATPWFFAAAALAGLGYSLEFTGGISLVARYAPPLHRAEMYSATYVVGYLFQGAGAVLLGVSATRIGLRATLVDAVPIISVLFLASLLCGLLVGRGRQQAAVRG